MVSTFSDLDLQMPYLHLIPYGAISLLLGTCQKEECNTAHLSGYRRSLHDIHTVKFLSRVCSLQGSNST